jgi:hypothetical protein
MITPRPYSLDPTLQPSTLVALNLKLPGWEIDERQEARGEDTAG